MKIAEFMGREIAPFRLTKKAADCEQLNCLLSKGKCLIISAHNLCQICDSKERGLVELPGLIRSLAGSVFVYGFEPTKDHSLLLQAISSGKILGIEPLPSGDTQFRVDPHSRSICRQFAGLSFGSAVHDRDLGFVEGDEQNSTCSLIRIGQRPFLVRCNDRGCEWILSACLQIADLDVIVDRNTSILRFFSSLVPFMMFVASNSPCEVWHNNAPQACFIVDDPLLTNRYGFLDYRKLLEVMEDGRSCTSMAFIPWNFRRSDRKVTELFSAHTRRFSLCVHGCDHTRGEFGSADYKLLFEKSQLAINRMTQHQRLSGLDFDRVMVFPQGIFSTFAPKALKACGYLAAVNSTLYPVDMPDGLRLRDLLEVAVTRFSDFPIFTRRRPDALAELAFDLFLGKPALLVEHHGYFKDGYRLLAEAVEKVNCLDERLEWNNLATICSRASLERAAGNGDVHVKFFTDYFLFKNETQQARKYSLFRSASREQSPTMTLNRQPADSWQEQDCLKTELFLNPLQTAEVRIAHQPTGSVAVPGREQFSYRAKVFIRRSLSEFRDNYVDKSQFLSKSDRKSVV